MGILTLPLKDSEYSYITLQIVIQYEKKIVFKVSHTESFFPEVRRSVRVTII